MIICPALKLEAFDEYRETLVPCHRHHNGYAILYHLMGNRRYKGHVLEGFMNHRGEFLTREEAYKEAKDCGQISLSLWDYKWGRNEIKVDPDSDDISEREGVLYSEDLY